VLTSIDLNEPPMTRRFAVLSNARPCNAVAAMTDEGRVYYYPQRGGDPLGATPSIYDDSDVAIDQIELSRGGPSEFRTCANSAGVVRMGDRIVNVSKLRREGSDLVLELRSETCEVIARWQLPHKSWESPIVCGRDTCAIAHRDGDRVGVWRMVRNKPRAESLVEVPSSTSTYSRVMSIAISDDEKTIALQHSNKMPLTIVSTVDGTHRDLVGAGGMQFLAWDGPDHLLVSGHGVGPKLLDTAVDHGVLNAHMGLMRLGLDGSIQLEATSDSIWIGRFVRGARRQIVGCFVTTQFDYYIVDL
jgi:hypothetical protein